MWKSAYPELNLQEMETHAHDLYDTNLIQVLESVPGGKNDEQIRAKHMNYDYRRGKVVKKLISELKSSD